MQIRLHEIETGATNSSLTAHFFSTVLGLPVKLQEHSLTVFDAGIPRLDFNVADHLPEGTVRISFITDDIKSMIQLLENNHIPYQGPYESHLGMLAIRFNAPNGMEIVVNTTTDSSPDWLQP